MSWFGLATFTTVSERLRVEGSWPSVGDFMISPGAQDGCVGAFHGFNRNAGGFGDHHRLPDIEPCQVMGDRAAIRDVGLLGVTRSARLVSTPSVASIGSSSSVEFIRVMPSSARTLADCADQRIGIARRQREQKLRQPPVGLDAAEYLLVLDLPGHDGAGDARALERLDQLGQLAQRQPMNRGGSVLLDLGRGLFLDGGDNNFQALGTSGLEHQQRELAVAGDQAESCRACRALRSQWLVVSGQWLVLSQQSRDSRTFCMFPTSASFPNFQPKSSNSLSP